jgi:hypothetical protein
MDIFLFNRGGMYAMLEGAMASHPKNFKKSI